MQHQAETESCKTLTSFPPLARKLHTFQFVSHYNQWPKLSTNMSLLFSVQLEMNKKGRQLNLQQFYQ